MKNKIIPHNTDKDGCASCIKANYYKMGGEFPHALTRWKKSDLYN